MSAVSLRASFYLPDCQINDRVRKKRPGLNLYYNKLQRQFTFPQRRLFGVIHNGSLRIYTEMLVAMPHFEFVKGIPAALEQDSNFDVNERNLIVFDDQMINASKDKRIMTSLLVVLIIEILA